MFGLRRGPRGRGLVLRGKSLGENRRRGFEDAVDAGEEMGSNTYGGSLSAAENNGDV